MRTIVRAIVVVLFSLGAAAEAQVANPGDAARSNGDQSSSQQMKPPPGGYDQRREQEGHTWHEPSYEQRPVEGGSTGEGGLVEEDRIGDYGQPRWTAHRRFPTTRIYVRPRGYFELEWWVEPEIEHGGGGSVDTLTEFEAELGLGHRIQLDAYLNLRKIGHDSEVTVDGEKIEVRYALADWGVIPGNPAFYLEYHAFNGKTNQPDTTECKLLLGGEITSRWHWGVNGVFERTLSGDLENEWGLTGGISYTVFDTNLRSEGLSVGAEVKSGFTDNTDRRRGNMHEEVLVGPSVQWRPYPAAHLDVVPLFGVTGFSPQFAPFIVFGWEF